MEEDSSLSLSAALIEEGSSLSLSLYAALIEDESSLSLSVALIEEELCLRRLRSKKNLFVWLDGSMQRVDEAFNKARNKAFNKRNIGAQSSTSHVSEANDGDTDRLPGVKDAKGKGKKMKAEGKALSEFESTLRGEESRTEACSVVKCRL
ncbi:hypothetical protein F2Q70_00027551 [Brassica cretica]|uniref:Uncharacterized protein n=1 Tax=Brassica cretica TaxID=69181 RepID=A0A8S9LFM5_BRACR|nr:hypothetical protein F2Q70_00027551 [Brassica cretica]